MTTETAGPPRKVGEIDPDPDRSLAELRRRFPGVCAWRGEFTGQWWALVRDETGYHSLIEASTPADLARRLDAVLPSRPEPYPVPEPEPHRAFVPRAPRTAPISAPVRQTLPPGRRTGAHPKTRHGGGRHAGRRRVWGLLAA